MTQIKIDPPVDLFKCNKCNNILSKDHVIASMAFYGIVSLKNDKYCWLGFICPNCHPKNLIMCKFPHERIHPFITEAQGIIYDNFGKIIYHSFPFNSKKIITKFPQSISQYIQKLGHENRPFSKKKALLQPINQHMQKLGQEISHISKEKIFYNPDDDSNIPIWLYSSYLYGTEALGPAIKIFWYDDEQIEHLASFETETGMRVFPRYRIYDPIYYDIESFCWKYRLHFEYCSDLGIGFPISSVLLSYSKKNLTKIFDFLNILDIQHQSDFRSYTSRYHTIIISQGRISKLPMSNTNKITMKTHEDLSEEIWSSFSKEYIQELLSKMADSFIDDYISMSNRIDFNYPDVWNLKQTYLKKIYDAIKSKHSRIKSLEQVKLNERKRVLEAESNFPNTQIISDDPNINDIKTQIVSLSKLLPLKNMTLLILGERGTGKNLFAKAFHEASGRTGNFIPVNCSSIPTDLIGSALFGHTKGAFTGALTEHKGYFEDASEGTIFLDEIGDLPKSQQGNLLKVIEEREYFPIGETNKLKKVSAMIILATNKNLSEMAEQVEFREDLYDRFKKPVINIPPLRKRKDDILLLTDHFIQKFCSDENIFINAKDIAPNEDFLSAIKSQKWMGNVRELSREINTILLKRESNKDNSPLNYTDIPNESRDNRPIPPKKTNEKSRRPKLTKEIIIKAMEYSNRNKTHAAKQLGCCYKTISRLCKQFNIYQESKFGHKLPVEPVA